MREFTEADLHAIGAAFSDYMEYESEALACEGYMKDARNVIAGILRETDTPKVMVPGLGSVSISNDSVRTSYDTKKLDELVGQLLDANTEITDRLARAIRDCRKTTTVPGSLRMVKK